MFIGPDVVVEPVVESSPATPAPPVPTPRRQPTVPPARDPPNDATGPREQLGREFLNAALSAGEFFFVFFRVEIRKR